MPLAAEPGFGKTPCEEAQEPPTDQGQHICAPSSVKLLQREYQRDDQDLFVETPDGGLPIRRVFRNTHSVRRMSP